MTRGDATLARISGGATARAALADVYLFARVSVLGFTAMLPLAGAFAVEPRIGAATVVGLLAIAAAFHLFAYVLNDVVDLELDRREPQRSRDPLVRGKVGPRAALLFAIVQLPAALLVAVSLDADIADLLALCAAFAALAAYNVWGKRCAVPPVIDLVQALGWACLTLFGALSAGLPNARVVWLCGGVVAYVMLVNAVHGGVRDLANDMKCGARTTAIHFGARVTREGVVVVPVRFVAYALALHAATIGAALAVLGRPSGGASWWIAAGLMAAVTVECARLASIAFFRRHEPVRAESAGVRHLFVAMALLAVPLAAHADAASLVTLAAVLVLPALATWAYRRAPSA
jgi:4-hydroxybenzoate polyprenyltransferase